MKMEQSRQGNGTAVLSVALTVEFDLADDGEADDVLTSHLGI